MKTKSFERALHRWDKWLKSVNNGRIVLGHPSVHPSLQKMKDTAQKALGSLGFPQCTLLELYWLCCVLTDYDKGGRFNFYKLILPDWFPFPFGFRYEEYINKEFLDLKGRISPPIVWSEAEEKFWQMRTPLARITGEPSGDVYERDFIVVLPDNHPMREKVRSGRPITDKADGEAILE